MIMSVISKVMETVNTIPLKIPTFHGYKQITYEPKIA